MSSPFPAGPPWLSSPQNCANDLMALNCCYDDIVQMKAIIQKVMVDLLANDPATIAAVQSAASLGITTGAPAAAGHVGEVLSDIPAAAIAVPANQWTQVATIALPPGDWQVWGSASFGATVGLTSFGASINVTGNLVPGNLVTTLLAQGGQAGTCPTPPQEFNVSVATSVSLIVMGTVGTSVTVGMWARRIR